MDKNKKLTLWLSMLVANAIILYVASLFFPNYIVLGNATLSSWLAAVVTAVALTVILKLVKPVLTAVKLKVKGDLPINITYFVANVVGLWVLAKFALYLGFGVTSFVVPVALGVVLTLLQFVVWKMVGVKK